MPDKGIDIGAAKNVFWGTNEKFSAWGYLRSDGQQGDGKSSELPDEWGQTIGMHLYDRKNTRTADIIMKKTAQVPQWGEDVFVDGKKFVCRGVSLNAENEAFKRLSLTLEAYQNIDGYSGGVDVK